eukprot:g5453.t1
MRRLMSSLIVAEDQRQALKVHALQLKDLVLNARQLCDVELLLNGGFRPVDGFLNRDDTESVYDNFRLKNGALWPMPINLDVSQDFISEVEASGKDEIALRDKEGNLIAVMGVGDVWTADKQREAESVFGGHAEHPAVAYLHEQCGDVYVGAKAGSLRGYQLPVHYDYRSLRHTPEELRKRFQENGWDRVVAFQTRNPMHLAHIELVRRAAEQADAQILIHPVVGLTKPGDVDYHTRLKCIRTVTENNAFGDNNAVELSVLPLAMRMAGPREALWHMIIRKNYGASHFILGRDHAGPGSSSDGKDFYGPYDARDFGVAHAKEVGIETVEFEMMVYLAEKKIYVPAAEVPEGSTPLKISGTEVRRRLVSGEEIPEWFSPKEVVSILRKQQPPRHEQGFTIFFTGLSGSGKSTIANALRERLLEMADRRTTLLDGDHVRHHLSSELSFSKEHRNLNIQRIGYVASEITKHGGVAICAAIAPFEESRGIARRLVEEHGTFIEVFVNTDIEECEKRDRKGLYAKARSGQLKGFTGIDDPYEVPEGPEVVVETDFSVDACVDAIVAHLIKEGLLFSGGAEFSTERRS